MSRVRWAVRYKHGKLGAYRYGYRMAANNEAVDSGGKVVRVTQYDAVARAETESEGEEMKNKSRARDAKATNHKLGIHTPKRCRKSVKRAKAKTAKRSRLVNR